jgi:putative addiction module component (TIGR02574 family)
MSADLLAEVLKLSPGERLELIATVWDMLSEDDVTVTREERAILDERLADLDNSRDAHSLWTEVKARLEQRRR